jgi:hypothetical protein
VTGPRLVRSSPTSDLVDVVDLLVSRFGEDVLARSVFRFGQLGALDDLLVKVVIGDDRWFAVDVVAAWLGDTVETVYKTSAHLMPDADERGRKAIDQFFRRPGREGSALDVASEGVH